MGFETLVLAKMTDWFPWYTWLCGGLLIVLLVGYKMYQNKMMR